MDVMTFLPVAGAVLAVAFLYSAVGHAGASGYIAVLALAGFVPDVIRPTALLLNILVAAIATVQFARAGHFRWGLFWPFALVAAPAAFAGGFLDVPARVFQGLVGGVLLVSAVRFVFTPRDPETVTPPRAAVALATGAGLGLLSGLTGTGGGIFLTPLMMWRRWATTKVVAATSAAFILVNSSTGLAGYLAAGRGVPPLAWSLAVAAVAGGALGSHYGSRRFPVRTIRRLLAVVLAIAGVKLVAGM